MTPLPADLTASLESFGLKSLALFALAGLALLALRRAPAASRHLVCLLTLLALVILPGLSAALPGWTVPALSLPALSLPGEPTPAHKFATPPETGGGRGSEPSAASGISSSSSRFGRTPVTEERGNKEVGSSLRPFPWILALILVWLLGVFFASLRPLLGLWGIGRLRRDCRPVADAPALALSSECAAALRLKRLPVLWQADVPVPMTWGWRRPVVLLPLTAAESWPADRLKAVLLHEQAHVRRGDWPCHRLADLICALYWFHPFAWWTARRLRAEGEMACDDLVLSSGVAAPDYARHLLDVARGLHAAPILPQAALAMAQSTPIGGRLKLILDPHRRRVLARRAWIAIVVLACGLVLFVATALTPPRSLMAAITSGGYSRDTPAHAEAGIAFLQGQIQRFGDQDPWAGKAYYVLGNEQMAAGHFNNASASFAKAIALPEPPYAHSDIHSVARYERINTLDAGGRYDEAVTETEALLKNSGRGLVTADLWENLRERLPELKGMRDFTANRAAEKAQYAALPADPNWTQALSNGVTVQLLGVMQSQGTAHTVWSPEGRILSRASYKAANADEYQIVPQSQARRILLRFRYPAGQALLTGYAADWRRGVSGEGLTRNNGAVLTDENQISPVTAGCRAVAMWFSPSQKETSLRVGVALVPPPLGSSDPSDTPKEWVTFSNVPLQPIPSPQGGAEGAKS